MKKMKGKERRKGRKKKKLTKRKKEKTSKGNIYKFLPSKKI